MMDWRRFFIAWAAEGAVIFAVNRPWPVEMVVGILTVSSVYFALGYLQPGPSEVRQARAKKVISSMDEACRRLEERRG